MGIDKLTTPYGADYPYSVKASVLAGLDMVSKTFFSVEEDCVSL